MEPKTARTPASPASNPAVRAATGGAKGAVERDEIDAPTPAPTNLAKRNAKTAKRAAKTTAPKGATGAKAPKASATLSAATRRKLAATVADSKTTAKAKTTARRTLREAGFAPDGKPLAATPAKGVAKSAPKRTASGPSLARIELAIRVAKARKRGDKWNEISAATGVSEPTLAKLRKDVRAGVFASVSPVAKRTPEGAF